MKPKVYVFDLDGVLCSKTADADYSKAKPYKSRIGQVNQLYDQGHSIVIWTARGTTTGKDWGKLTKQQLKRWGVKYHELRLGKPYYDYYIDDKGINSLPFFGELWDWHLNPDKHSLCEEMAWLVTNFDVYGKEGIIKWM